MKIKATPKFQTRTVWAGMYGGHYDQIVFFSQKPKRSGPKSQMFPKGYYECLDNQSIIIGDLCLASFEDFFDVDLTPYLEDGRPKAIEIIEVFQIELTAQFDEDGHLPFRQDW